MNKLSFIYRSLSNDWIASFRLENGVNLNFYCGKMKGCRAVGDDSVPWEIELEASRLFPKAIEFWKKIYLTCFGFFVLMRI
jgi:hypothetical protein